MPIVSVAITVMRICTVIDVQTQNASVSVFARKSSAHVNQRKRSMEKNLVTVDNVSPAIVNQVLDRIETRAHPVPNPRKAGKHFVSYMPKLAANLASREIEFCDALYPNQLYLHPVKADTWMAKDAESLRNIIERWNALGNA